MIEYLDLSKLQFLERTTEKSRVRQETKNRRGIGLRDFYQEMADPSMDFINNFCANIISAPSGYLRRLDRLTRYADKNPERFFSGYGSKIDPEKIRDGINNTRELLNGIKIMRLLETDREGKPYKINMEMAAEAIHERIHIKQNERKIVNTADEVKNEGDVAVRGELGFKLKRQVLDCLTRFPYENNNLNDPDRLVDDVWKSLIGGKLSVNYEAQSLMPSSSEIVLTSASIIAETAMQRSKFEEEFEKIPKPTKERFDELRIKYGAKAANLILLSERVELINHLISSVPGRFKLVVPDFIAVPVELHRAWKEGKLTEDDLRPYYHTARGYEENQRVYSDGHILRSSAKKSEDGDKLTGAGIYTSVHIPEGSSLEEFTDGIDTVYDSVESERAREYREQNEIDDEEMGLLIQKYVALPDNKLLRSGSINSTLPGLPNLMECVIGKNRTFIDRKALDFVLHLDPEKDEKVYRQVFHYPPDTSKIPFYMPLYIAKFAYIIEKLWNKNIITEFVFDDLFKLFNGVQVRALPLKTADQAREIVFPEKQPIHTGASIGIGDVTLPVLANRRDVCEKDGVVIFNTNFTWSANYGEDYLPKTGAVIIAGKRPNEDGHIQTLCAERGLICIYQTDDGKHSPDKPVLSYDELGDLAKIRVISNGMEGRVYPVNDDTEF